MNNNHSQWYVEQMARYGRGDMDRALERARWLREAGRPEPGRLARAVNGLIHLLQAHRKGLLEHRSMKEIVFQGKSPDLRN